MFPEQALQGADRRFRRLVQDRQPGKLAAAGQITHGQQVRPAAVNGPRWLGMVHGPHDLRIVPMEHVDRARDGRASRCGGSGF